MARTVLHIVGHAHYSDAVSRLSRVGGISREKGESKTRPRSGAAHETSDCEDGLDDPCR